MANTKFSGLSPLFILYHWIAHSIRGNFNPYSYIRSTAIFLKHPQCIQPETFHPHNVNKRVDQRVECYCDDVGQQPNVFLQKLIRVVPIQEVLISEIHCHNISGIVQKYGQVEDDVYQSDNDYSDGCLALHSCDDSRGLGCAR